mgnify:CR=1 FL=1
MRWFGSSPRERGTHGGPPHGQGARRFIPARAGNTVAKCSGFGRTAVHPRASGEHPRAAAITRIATGSSPRERGTHHHHRRHHHRRRFIPARAGNTVMTCPRWNWRTVHPRASGEHLRIPHESHSHLGSSPRERGTLRLVAFTGRISRFIPARAGNTHGGVAGVLCGAVHPRASGEHLGYAGHAGASVGSSPRERGTRLNHNQRRNLARFIPARAGNTPASRIG